MRNITTGPLREQTGMDNWQEPLVRTGENRQFFVKNGYHSPHPIHTRKQYPKNEEKGKGTDEGGEGAEGKRGWYMWWDV
jgi:hypothetical protein